MAESYRVFGKAINRIDGLEKLTGRALYAGDMVLPNMLYLKVLRSDRPHANILKIQTEKAERHPGVVAVFTHKDIPGTNRVGVRIKDQPVLCDDKVRLFGDPVAMVAAESLQAAEEAIRLIEIDFKDLPGIFSPEEALLPNAVKIHDSGNLLMERELLKGDPDQALKKADVVIANTYRTQMVDHVCLEPEAAVARYENGRVTVWMPTKHAHFEQKEIAEVLGLPREKVRIILTTVGGSFGAKQCLSPAYYAALVSFKTGRPSKMVYTREEMFLVSTKRHPCLIHYTTGAKKDGQVVAVKAEILSENGAYASYGPSVAVRGMVHGAGPYEIPNVYVRARTVYTNHPIGGALRGFGVPPVVVAHESQMDLLAETLKMDPFEIRLKNGLRPDSLTATGQPLGPSVGLSETLRKVREEIDRMGTPQPSGPKRYGWGVASMYYGIGLTGLINPGVCWIEVNECGEFTIYLGCGDVGQGSVTVAIQIAAEVLKCEPKQFRLIAGDTDRCPDSGANVSSRGTYVVCRSVEIAAQNLREMLKEAAASMIEIAKEDLFFEDGFFYPPEAPHRKASISQVVRRLNEERISPVGKGEFNPETTHLDPSTSQGVPYATYAFATQAALVSVDLESGEVEVLKVVACHDVGKAVNPMNVEGQIIGGVSWGLGYALTEEVILRNGVIQNPRFSEYFIPTAMDVSVVEPLFVEAQEPTGPYGAKGVGEPASLPTAPAILNAIHSATGVRVLRIPLTAEELWKLLREKNQSKEEFGSGDQKGRSDPN